jgi:hypothetical protein
MAQKQIEVKINNPVYDYFYYLEDAVESNQDFKYSNIYQIGARFSVCG